MPCRSAVAPDPRPPCALIADDSAGMRRYLVAILASAGFDCVEASDGAEAFDVVLGGGVDLVVTDLDMPEMDGFGLIAAIRLLSPRSRPPVVVVSGLLDETLAERRPELRTAVSLLAKPVQPADLLRAVARAVGAHLPPI
jgi:two-component system chemotaxis response regulator CheY